MQQTCEKGGRARTATKVHVNEAEQIVYVLSGGYILFTGPLADLISGDWATLIHY
jgi:hypothetical protein